MVRETDGVLREASWEERDRMCQVTRALFVLQD